MAGKYALIEVPGYTSQANETKTSFLRLGAYPEESDVGALPGYDLASKFPGYFDDERARSGGPDFREVADRKAETAKLFTRGGWWDHSDGNRITTTRGDKLEVIRGNYRLAVLGWQDDWGSSAGVDMSGGIIRDPQRLPGEIYSVEWKDTWKGTWRVTEKCERGDIHEEFWGNKVAHAYGDIFHENVGSASPSDEQPNPEIQEKVWASTIKGYTGSSSLPIEEIYDETWGLTLNENTFALAKTGTTNVLGVLAEHTMAVAIVSNELYGAKVGLEEGITSVEINLLGNKSELSVIATKLALEVNVGSIDIGVSGIKTDIFVGQQVGVTVGNVIEAFLGVNIGLFGALKVELGLGGLLEVIIGGKIGVFLGPSLEVSTLAAKISIAAVEELTPKKNWHGLKLSLG